MKTQLESSWNMIFIPFVIKHKNNRMESFSFLFDTGAAATEMSHETAGRLGISGRDATGMATVETLGGTIKGYSVKLPEIQLFGRSFTDFKIRVFDIAVTEDNDDEIDGIIGMDLIKQFKILIDGPARELKIV